MWTGANWLTGIQFWYVDGIGFIRRGNGIKRPNTNSDKTIYFQFCGFNPSLSDYGLNKRADYGWNKRADYGLNNRADWDL